jgi:hypothetical protein
VEQARSYQSVERRRRLGAEAESRAEEAELRQLEEQLRHTRMERQDVMCVPAVCSRFAPMPLTRGFWVGLTAADAFDGAQCPEPRGRSLRSKVGVRALI